MKAERFVVDTNVLISASLRGSGPPARLLEAFRSARVILLFSDETLAELHDRLLQKKFDAYVTVSLRKQFLAQLDAVSERVFIPGSRMGCRDLDDDKFLETAVLGNADCIVTGDRDLLILHPFQDIPILSPADALTMYFGR